MTMPWGSQHYVFLNIERGSLCRHTISALGENISSENSQLHFCMRYKRVQVFESHACFRILGTHFVTKRSQQERAGRGHTLDLEPSYLEQTENIQKQNQSHGLAWKNKHPPPQSYFLNCTPGRVWSGRIWKGGETKALTRGPSRTSGGKKKTHESFPLWHCSL